MTREGWVPGPLCGRGQGMLPRWEASGSEEPPSPTTERPPRIPVVCTQTPERERYPRSVISELTKVKFNL